MTSHAQETMHASSFQVGCQDHVTRNDFPLTTVHSAAWSTPPLGLHSSRPCYAWAVGDNLSAIRHCIVRVKLLPGTTVTLSRLTEEGRSGLPKKATQAAQEGDSKTPLQL